MAVLVSLVVFGCGGHDPAPYLAAVDDLRFPPTWRIAHTTVMSQGGPNGCIELVDGHCPTITRYFLVDGSLSDSLDETQTAVASQGFVDIKVGAPSCDAAASSVAPSCSLTAAKDDMALQITLYRPGTDVDGLGISTTDRGTVRLILHRN